MNKKTKFDPADKDKLALKFIGLPDTTTEDQILQVFKNYKIAYKSVNFDVNDEGKRNGVCILKLTS